ncbi:LAFA_0G03092g1_1 [Lachancea sp. 'fantastica']|nr:LAFA_0G03092g1_1 [Lachancea sp. 'fantastica']
MSRLDLDVERAVRKACSYEETAPKRKHVRACIVYTWDQKSSRAIFNAFKVQPLAQDDISLFKALITIHKILQEGHPSAIVEGIKNRDWIESLGRIYDDRGGNVYGRLINEYVGFLLEKLNFHRLHAGFNGTFEYEEYMSLVTTSNPDEGYESILDMMDLQDRLDRFGRIVFSSISSGRRNECRISALVPLVSESYGIYKFIMSMIRAMHSQTGEDGALEPLYSRFCEEHARLFEFYADCSAIKYLTGLIRIPKLPSTPPSIQGNDEDVKISRPSTRLSNVGSESSAHSSKVNLSVGRSASQLGPYNTGGNGVAPGSHFSRSNSSVYVDNKGVQGQLLAEREKMADLRRQQELIELQQQKQQREAEEQRLALEQESQRQHLLQEQQYQLEAERQQQIALQQQEQAIFEQRMREEQQAQYERVAQNAQWQNDLNALRDQHDRDQVMLQQYDGRVAALEKELESLNMNVESQYRNHEEQLRTSEEWKEKYEGLASLYSQLRQEHLAVLKKLKKSQQIESSAREAVARYEAADTVGMSVTRVETVSGMLLMAAANSVKLSLSDAATNLANDFNNLVLGGELQPFTNSLMAFVRASGSNDFLLALKNMKGDPEEVVEKVIELNVAYQSQL